MDCPKDEVERLASRVSRKVFADYMGKGNMSVEDAIERTAIEAVALIQKDVLRLRKRDREWQRQTGCSDPLE